MVTRFRQNAPVKYFVSLSETMNFGNPSRAGREFVQPETDPEDDGEEEVMAGND